MYQRPWSITYNVKRYFKFSTEEMRGLLIGIFIVAFLVSFDEWGVETFNVMFGLRNFLNAILIITLAFLFRIAVQRVIGLSLGYKVEYRMWLYGLLTAIVLIIVSNGKLWLIVPGGLLFYHMPGHRLGAFRYGLNYFPVGVIGFFGPMSNLFLAMLFKWLLVYFPGNILLHKGMVVNIWFALFTMLPIPPLDGSHALFATRYWYAFTATLVLVLAISLYFLSIFASIIIALLVAIAVWFAYLWISGKI